MRDWGAPPYLAGEGGLVRPRPRPGGTAHPAAPRLLTHRKRTDRSGGVRKSRRHSILSTCCTCAPPSTCEATRLVCTASCARPWSRKPETRAGEGRGMEESRGGQGNSPSPDGSELPWRPQPCHPGLIQHEPAPKSFLIHTFDLGASGFPQWAQPPPLWHRSRPGS